MYTLEQWKYDETKSLRIIELSIVMKHNLVKSDHLCLALFFSIFLCLFEGQPIHLECELSSIAKINVFNPVYFCHKQVT